MDLQSHLDAEVVIHPASTMVKRPDDRTFEQRPNALYAVGVHVARNPTPYCKECRQTGA